MHIKAFEIRRIETIMFCKPSFQNNDSVCQLKAIIVQWSWVAKIALLIALSTRRLKSIQNHVTFELLMLSLSMNLSQHYQFYKHYCFWLVQVAIKYSTLPSQKYCTALFQNGGSFWQSFIKRSFKIRLKLPF